MPLLFWWDWQRGSGSDSGSDSGSGSGSGWQTESGSDFEIGEQLFWNSYILKQFFLSKKAYTPSESRSKPTACRDSGVLTTRFESIRIGQNSTPLDKKEGSESGCE